MRIIRWLAAVAIPGFFCLTSARADPPAFTKKTFVFKTVAKVPIHADVHRAADGAVRPVVVWLHGGALIMGSRTGVPKNLLELCRKESYALVSFDYRLAPETKLPGIIDDIKDAFAWLRKQSPKLCLDAERVVVAGGSAGGYLTMMTGICVTPRPPALVAYWGYGDVDGDWYTKPSEHYRKAPLISKETATKAVGRGVPTGTGGGAPEQKIRGQYYLYLRQNGLWTKEVTGFDPATQRAQLDPYCPVRNITKAYPPIVMIHGTKDTDVPHELSANMAKELTKHQVPHELITVEGGGHGLGGGDPKRIAEAHAKALEFIRKHLQGPRP